MKYYTFECEWDIGINDNAYSTEEIAKAHIDKAFADCGMDDGYTADDAIDDGMLHFESHNTDDFVIIDTLP